MNRSTVEQIDDGRKPHKKLDKAVFAAYGWDPDLSDGEILEKLLALNLERAAEQDS